jgi:hypothetical protein
MIHKWHIPISGFTQGIDRANGFDKLWLKLRDKAGENVSVVTPQRWSADFDSLADFIDRMSPDGKTPEINIYAYSWGCGRGFIQLSEELGKRGLIVLNAVLCDPVFYSRWRPWRAMVASPAITIPKNVNQVYWFYQRQNRPCATELRPLASTTAIAPGVELRREHAWMDDAPQFHEKCMEVAAI